MKRDAQTPLPAGPHYDVVITVHGTIEHYWTFRFGGENYGIMQYSSTPGWTDDWKRPHTLIIWKGSIWHEIPVTAPWAVAITGFLVILLAGFIFWSLWSGFHHWSGAFSREEHPSKSPG